LGDFGRRRLYKVRGVCVHSYNLPAVKKHLIQDSSAFGTGQVDDHRDRNAAADHNQIHDENWVRRARSPEGGLQITRGARFVGSVWVVSQFLVVHLFTDIFLAPYAAT